NGPVNKLSYALQILGTLTDYTYPLVEVEIGDTGEHLRGALVFVFNIPRYAMNLPIAFDAQADDGWLDVYIFERPGLWNLTRYLLAVVTGRQRTLPDFQRRRARRVRLTSTAQVPLQTDGDPAGCLGVEIEVVPRAMTLVVPHLA